MRRVLSLMLIIFLGAGSAYAYAQQHHEHAMGEMAVHGQGEEENLGICPVLGHKAGKEYSYTYGEKTYYFCCPSCVEKFRKGPEAYISKIKEISVEAYQFGFSPDPIVVKKGDIVKLTAVSRDVPHGIYIKGYGINVSLSKHEAKEIDFAADKAGEFEITCSIYCGRGHNQMRGKLIVEE